MNGRRPRLKKNGRRGRTNLKRSEEEEEEEEEMWYFGFPGTRR
jgi:hypothetical protein